jgi:hypothetical protein
MVTFINQMSSFHTGKKKKVLTSLATDKFLKNKVTARTEYVSIAIRNLKDSYYYKREPYSPTVKGLQFIYKQNVFLTFRLSRL